MQTAALAQKNSEATRALAVQGEVLEKELGEIQKVLLAMQVELLFITSIFPPIFWLFELSTEDW